MRPALSRALLCALSITLILSAHATARAQSKDAKAAAAAASLERGKSLLKSGDAAGAAVELKRAADGRKTDADAWQLLGVALNRAGDNKGARKAFEKALKLRPDDANARTGLAYTLLVLGKLKDSEREARRAVALSPHPAEARYVVAVLHYRRNQFKEAEAEAEAALRINPALGAAAYLAGDSLMALYFDEADRLATLYPSPPGAGDEAQRAAFARRAAALEPYRSRMRDLASRLEKIIEAQPTHHEADLWREQAGSMRFYGREGGEDPGVFRGSEVTARAVIYSKPEPGYTEDARRNHVTGTVRLRAVLSADGRVRHIAVVRGLPDGLTDKCVRAARQIRFKPAVKDGHAVSQHVALEYNFNIY